MNIKNIFFILLLGGLFFYYTIVDSSFYKDSEINFEGSLGDNIYLDSSKLDKNIIFFSSNKDISNYQINSLCNIKTKFVSKLNDNYIFQIDFLDNNCYNNNFSLKTQKGDIITNTHFTLNLIKDFDLYNKLTDYNDNNLKLLQKDLIEKKEKLNLFSNIVLSSKNLNFIKKGFLYNQYVYNLEKVEEILEKRKIMYQIPVVGHKLPDGKNISKFPNGPRPYRADYTIGVHEGWDIDAPYGTEVIALDDGIIVNIVSGFKFEDLKKIKKDDNLTYTQKLINLNYLRGNQVWIKTMKGDLAFYSHLSEISKNLKVGDIVKKGDYVGNIGITGIPDKNYKDYHLHIELRKNPYLISKTGKYTNLDYMGWDWYLSDKKVAGILENQYNIFKN